MPKYSPKSSEVRPQGLGTQDIYEFDNGYSASVVRSPYTYGGPNGLFELAVMVNGDLTYNTPITNDVIGHLTDDGVQEILAKINALPQWNKEEEDRMAKQKRIEDLKGQIKDAQDLIAKLQSEMPV